MRLIVRPRQAGKTSAMVRWVKRGEPTNSYPFWSRIILCATTDEAQRLRTDEKWGLDYTQVFGVQEWARARKGHLPVEVGIDNLDRAMYGAIGHVTLASVDHEGRVPDEHIPYPQRWCQCMVPLPSGHLNSGAEVCTWCTYLIGDEE